VMASKYGKLLLNLNNVFGAAFADDAVRRRWTDKARAEAIAVYEAAGIDWQDVGEDDPRRAQWLRRGRVDGAESVGSSSRQSIMRDSGSIETDYLNGEIALLGRLHGVPTPVNAAATRIGQKLVDGRIKLGEATNADIEAEFAAAATVA
jgi:2-dehydropantoate 2-reductase